jgi:hypothetical protein
MVILTRIKFHTIFYAYTSPLHKYWDVIIHAENVKNYMALQDSVLVFSREGHLNISTAFFHYDMKD